MWKRKLCLATSGQFARPVEEQIRLFAATGFEGFFSDCFAHGSSDFDFGALFDAFGGGGNKGFAGEVVDELYVDLFVATEDSHAGTGSSAGDAAADASLDFISSVYLGDHDGVNLFIWHRQSCRIYDE